MTDDTPDQTGADDLDTGRGDDAGEAPREPTQPVRTGVTAVDDVLVDIDHLDTAPLEEHLSAFESAHAALRSALDTDPGEPA